MRYMELNRKCKYNFKHIKPRTKPMEGFSSMKEEREWFRNKAEGLGTITYWRQGKDGELHPFIKFRSFELN